MADDKRTTGQAGGRDASTKDTAPRPRTVIRGTPLGNPRDRGASRARGSVRGSDSGGDTPTGQETTTAGEPAASTIRVVDTDYVAPPPPKAEKEKAPPKKNTVPVNTRRAAAENVVRDAIDLGNMAAIMLVGPLPEDHPMRSYIPVTLTGTPEEMRVERTEYERLVTHGSNVLSRFDFVTKLQTTSDVGSIVAVLVAWGMRLYMLWVLKHPDQPVNLPNVLPFVRRKPQEAPTHQADPYQNGRPPDIDLSSMGAFTPVIPNTPEE